MGGCGEVCNTASFLYGMDVRKNEVPRSEFLASTSCLLFVVFSKPQDKADTGVLHVCDATETKGTC